jgi:chemotaxis protein CheX
MPTLEEKQVSEAVESIWSTMLGLEATPASGTAAKAPKLTTLTGCIQITGAWQGAIKLECSGSVARRVAAIMFNIDACDVTGDEINDAVGELTNIVGGNIKSLLPEPSQLSMPAVTEGTDYLFIVPNSRPMAHLSFFCEGKPFHVTILESKK